jgi:hypothetical protein
MRVEFSDFTQLLFGSEFGHCLLMESSHSLFEAQAYCLLFLLHARVFFVLIDAPEIQPASALGENE